MKHLIMTVMALIMLTLSSIGSFAEEPANNEESATEPMPEAAPAAYPAAAPAAAIEGQTDYKKLNQNGLNKKFKTLGFKGLHLGMTRDEVKELIKPENGWHKRFDHQDIDTVEHVFLYTNFPIGCEGEGETEKCYTIDSVTVGFFQDKVNKIGLDSDEYSATDIDYYVKGWANFALKALKTKYGKPTKTNAKIDSVAAFFINSGYSRRMNEWAKKGESVYLSIGCNEFKYYAGINLVNTAVEAKIKKEKKKMKSEL